MYPIRIVLVETSHAGNIGATARAMKNMGLTELHLVRPLDFPCSEAYARAAGADDVLDNAQVHSSFSDAVAECGLVIGTSARSRYLHWDLVEPRECARRAIEAARLSRVALVFGTERTGLTNEELALCNLLVTIPTHPGYSSLNVSMAAQVLTYEFWLAQRDGVPVNADRDVPLSTGNEMARLYEHIEAVLQDIEFHDRSGGGQLMSRIRRLFNRAQLDQNEMNILRGILTAVQAKRRPAANRTVPARREHHDG